MELMNVVFMGMGEPLLNFEHLVTTLDVLYRNVAPKRITVSTSGIIPGIDELAKLPRRPNLAVSINAPDRRRREEIMPITKKYPLDELIASLKRYPSEKGREITIEYVLLAGYNDSHARRGGAGEADPRPAREGERDPVQRRPEPAAWMKRPTDGVDRPLRRHARAQRRGRDGAAFEGPRHRRGVRPVAREGGREEPRARTAAPQ